MTFWLAQAIGAIAFVLIIVSFQTPRRERILTLRALAHAVFTLHFWMLGASTAAAVNAIGVARTYVSRERTRSSWADGHGWLAAFIIVIAGITALTWQGPWSLLPAAGMILSTVALWSKEPRTIRYLSLIPPPLWITYDLHIGSYAGMATDAFLLLSVIIAIVRFDIRKELLA